MVVSQTMVDEIIAEDDLVLRNLRISATYGRLADEFADLVGPGDAPWVQFGTWTSEEVGLAIRGQQTERHWFLRTMRRVRRDYDELAAEAAGAFSESNTAVFDQVGRSFVGFHDALRAADREAALRTFLAGLPDDAYGGADGIPTVTLEAAFAAYAFAVAAEPDDAVGRTRSVALGNLALAVVEQCRVQGPIDTAFNVFAEGWPFRSFTTKVASRMVTELALEVTMGDVRVKPGHGLPPGLHVPPDLVDLVVADPRFGPYADLLPPDPPDSDRWTDLVDRLRFIAALMPLLQQSPRLLDTSPFTDDERAEIEARTVPKRFR